MGIYVTLERLVNELKDVNLELQIESIIEIEKLLVQLISKLFPRKTDSIFTSAKKWV